MKATAWIDRVKVAKHVTSDYAVAKHLGLTQAAISRIRTHESTLSEDTAMAVAAALGINPAGVILDQVAERVKSAAVRSTLSKLSDELCILCSITVARVLIATNPYFAAH
jgi:transcriptional regulator with XRE-family HTH domain